MVAKAETYLSGREEFHMWNNDCKQLAYNCHDVRTSTLSEVSSFFGKKSRAASQCPLNLARGGLTSASALVMGVASLSLSLGCSAITRLTAAAPPALSAGGRDGDALCNGSLTELISSRPPEPDALSWQMQSQPSSSAFPEDPDGHCIDGVDGASVEPLASEQGCDKPSAVCRIVGSAPSLAEQNADQQAEQEKSLLLMRQGGAK